jgi:hypothetical protein
MPLLEDLSDIEPLNGPVVSLRDLRQIGSTKAGKLLLGMAGTALLVRYASAPGDRLRPKDPDEVKDLDDPPGVIEA